MLAVQPASPLGQSLSSGPTDLFNLTLAQRALDGRDVSPICPSATGSRLTDITASGKDDSVCSTIWLRSMPPKQRGLNLEKVSKLTLLSQGWLSE
jgi:hypothetical protein